MVDRSQRDSSPPAFDRLPPQNLDAERALLGSMLLSYEAIDEVAELVQARHFYLDAHVRIAEAIFRLSETTIGGIDAVTVAEELEKRGELDRIGGPAYLARVLETVPHAAHARYYAEIVRDKFVRRMLREASTAILKEIDEDDSETEALLGNAEARIFQILDREGEDEKFSLRDILEDAMSGIHSRIADEGTVSGISSGFEKLDDLTSGLQPAALVIVAARPSMGKTAFVCNIAKSVALNAYEAYQQQLSPPEKGPGGGVIVFSLEQSRVELAERLLCIFGKFDGLKVKKGELDAEETEQLLQIATRLSELPIFIDDIPGRNMAQISAICRRIKNRFGLGMVVIDYLQLIEPDDPKMPREQQVAQIARRLKFLAKEMSVPVIALAQLNRGVDLRTDKRPKLADLRESGAIEQDADLVMFLHREDAYDPGERPGEADLIVAKNRNGPTGNVPLTWIKESMRFESRSDFDEPPGGWVDSEPSSF